MKSKQATKDEDSRKVAIYARKSKLTETGKSIDVQIERCTAIATARFNVKKEDIAIYIDEGKSGFYSDRPEYVNMLNAIERKEIKAVICYKIDRISRHVLDLLNLVEQMERKKVEFIASDSDIDTTSRSGKMMLQMLGIIAEFERDIIRERIVDNLYELAKEGRWLGGTTPLGFYSQKTKTTVSGHQTTINHLEPIPEEQVVVRKAFDTFLRLDSLTGTATELNNDKLFTKNNKPFTLVAVRNILTNPVYAVADKEMYDYFQNFNVNVWSEQKAFNGTNGIMAYNKTEQTKEIRSDAHSLDPRYTQKTLRRDITEWVVAVGKHKGIVSGSDWIKTQSMISENAKISARPKESSQSLLSGLIRCVDCGSRMFVRAESGRKNPDGTLRFRYVCDVKYRKKGDCTNSPNVSGYQTDNLVVDAICRMSIPESDYFIELANSKKTLAAKNKDTLQTYNTLIKRIVEIDNDIQNQVVSVRTAPEDIKDFLYADIKKLSTEKEESAAKLEEIEKELDARDNQIADIEAAKNALLSFPKMFSLVCYEQKLALINKIVECVIIKDDTLHIFLKGSEYSDFFQKERERSDLCHKEQDSVCYTAPLHTGFYVSYGSRGVIHISHCFYDDLGRASVGERVRRFRIKRGITVNELAQNSNISRDAIISYENGQTEPSPKILLSIAAALSVNSDKLCDEYYRFLFYPYGKRIKGIRKGLGLTQQEFAETYGFTLTMVKRWEQGRNRVTREQLEKLSHISKPYVA